MDTRPPKDSDEPSDSLIDAKQVAMRLNVSPKTIYKLRRSGELRSIMVGSRIRFRLQDVEAYIEEHER